MIKVVPYDANWQMMYEIEASRIVDALGDNCLAIFHIGSTSVPGLSAKPIIDILPVVEDICKVKNESMEQLGYTAKGENGIAFRRYFQLPAFNVHIYEEGDSEIWRYLKFRDWLRTHDEDAQQYAKLKMELAAKYPDNILQYCMGKDEFVASIDAKNGFEGRRLVQALTDREWQAVKRMRIENFFEGKEDPFAATFNHKDHVHFVLYQNAQIVGYAHLQLWPDQRAVMRMLIIDKPHRKKHLGRVLVKLCERWLSHQDFKQILIQCPKVFHEFYKNLGYTYMPSNDPEGHATLLQDIELGKYLLSKNY